MLGGCGGGSAATTAASTAASTDASTTPGSRPESGFIAKADAICARLNSQISGREPSKITMSEIARLSLAHATLEQKALNELTRLVPPSSLAGDWKRIIAYRRTLIDELIKFAQYAKANDTRAVQTLSVSKEQVHRKLTATAKRAGFTACARVG
jgi:hypothetical protein